MKIIIYKLPTYMLQVPTLINLNSYCKYNIIIFNRSHLYYLKLIRSLCIKWAILFYKGVSKLINLKTIRII